jgi:hypothetical protein
MVTTAFPMLSKLPKPKLGPSSLLVRRHMRVTLLKLKEGVDAGLSLKSIVKTLYGYEDEDEIKIKLHDFLKDSKSDRYFTYLNNGDIHESFDNKDSVDAWLQ